MNSDKPVPSAYIPRKCEVPKLGLLLTSPFLWHGHRDALEQPTRVLVQVRRIEGLPNRQLLGRQREVSRSCSGSRIDRHVAGWAGQAAKANEPPPPGNAVACAGKALQRSAAEVKRRHMHSLFNAVPRRRHMHQRHRQAQADKDVTCPLAIRYSKHLSVPFRA